MRKTKAHNSTNDHPRRHLLGFAVLLLTLGGGYLVAQRAVARIEIVGAVDAVDAVEEDNPRSAPTLAEIMEQIDTVAARYKVPPRLVAAIIAVESEFNPRAVSRRGARGLMQLMPSTAATLDVENVFDARENIEGGVRHLRVLMDRYHNDLPLVLAAYNAGDQAVVTYRGIPPFRETRQYVIRVLRHYDREAARAAARRIYGPGSTARTPAPIVKTQLASFDGETPPVVVFPVRMIAEPTRMIGERTRVIDEPIRLTGDLIRVTGEPIRVTGEPIRVTGEPAVTGAAETVPVQWTETP